MRYEEENELQIIFAEEKVTVSMIKERLRYHNQPLSGRKQELAKRLIHFLTPYTANLPLVAHDSLTVTYNITDDGNLDVVDGSDDSESDANDESRNKS
jgi:hypothetical protein